jgi:hypothetical protein
MKLDVVDDHGPFGVGEDRDGPAPSLQRVVGLPSGNAGRARVQSGTHHAPSGEEDYESASRSATRRDQLFASQRPFEPIRWVDHRAHCTSLPPAPTHERSPTRSDLRCSGSIPVRLR